MRCACAIGGTHDDDSDRRPSDRLDRGSARASAAAADRPSSQRRRGFPQRRSRRRPARPHAAFRRRLHRAVPQAPARMPNSSWSNGIRRRNGRRSRTALNWPADFGPATRTGRHRPAKPARLVAAFRRAAAVPDDRQERRHSPGARTLRARDQYRHSVRRRDRALSARPAEARHHAACRPLRRPGRPLPENVPFDRVLGRMSRPLVPGPHPARNAGRLTAAGCVGRDDGDLASRLLALYCEAQIFGWGEPIGRAGERACPSGAGACDMLWRCDREVTRGEARARRRGCCFKAARRASDRLWRRVDQDHAAGDLAQSRLLAHPPRLAANSDRTAEAEDAQHVAKGRANAKALLRRIPKAWELIGPGQMTSANARRATTRAHAAPSYQRLRRFHPVVPRRLVSAARLSGMADLLMAHRFRLHVRGQRQRHLRRSRSIPGIASTISTTARAPAGRMTARRNCLRASTATACPTSATNSSGKSSSSLPRRRTSAIVNDEDWGLVDYSLDEREVAPAPPRAAGACAARTGVLRGSSRDEPAGPEGELVPSFETVSVDHVQAYWDARPCNLRHSEQAGRQPAAISTRSNSANISSSRTSRPSRSFPAGRASACLRSAAASAPIRSTSPVMARP